MRRSTFVLALIAALAGGICQTAASQPPAPPVERGPAKQIADLVGAYHELGQFDGVVLVADHGQIVHRGAYGLANREWNVPHSLESRFEIASMTKPMTTIAILQLVDEGKVRLDAPVAEYLPAFRDAPGKQITIEQLLVHSSGLQQDIAFPDGDEVPPIVAKINADLVSLDEMVRLIAQRPLQFAPGTRFGYSSDGYAVLGAVIQQVTGKDYWNALAERVLQPAAMKATVPALDKPLVPNRVAGYRQTFDGIENGEHIGASPAGGLYSTVADLFAWERALAGDKLLSAPMKKRVFAVRDVITAYGWKTREELRQGRKVLVARTTGGLPGFLHVLERIPSEDRVIIALSNVRGPVLYVDRLVTGIHAVLDGKPAEVPRRSVAMAIGASSSAGAAALALEIEQIAADTAHCYVDEGEINSLGYHLLNARHDAPGAVAVFAFNAARFPRSPNAHDSLGEAQLAAGDRASAILSYRKVLELDPGNANATKVLERLEH
jgi:CubicO group peptidase (beta-lactamase class C family)